MDLEVDLKRQMSGFTQISKICKNFKILISFTVICDFFLPTF